MSARVRLVALSVVFVILGACVHDGPVLGNDMPTDLVELVDATLQTVEDEAPARADCLQGLVIRHAWELDDRAQYDPDTSTVVLRVPSTASRLEFSLVHEIAHHFEYTCQAQAEIRSAFLDTQGLDPNTAWFEGDPWEEIPSEQFATALAMVVTDGTDTMRRVRVTDESLELVDLWAKGDG